MQGFEEIVGKLRKNKGARFGFAVAEGAKGAPMVIVADKKKPGSSLKNDAKKFGKLLAFGQIFISDKDETIFSCDFCAAGFKKTALKPYFAKIKEKPEIFVDPADEVENPDQPDDNDAEIGAAADDDTLIVLWSRDLAQALREKHVEEEKLAGLNQPAQARVPAIFMRTLRANNAQPFAQKIVDAYNAEFDKHVTLAARAYAKFSDEGDAQAAQVLAAFEKKCETLMEQAWAAFVKRFESPKGLGKKKFKAYAGPAVGGTAAAAGLATSLAAGPAGALGAAASSVALVRAATAAFDAFRVFDEEIALSINRLGGHADRLNDTFLDAKRAIKPADTAKEKGRAIAVALTGSGLPGTLNTIRGDVDILDARLAKREQKIGNALPKIFKVSAKLGEEAVVINRAIKALRSDAALMATDAGIKKLEAHLQLRKANDMAGAPITAALERITKNTEHLDSLRAEISHTQGVIAKLDSGINGEILDIEQMEKTMTLLVNFLVFTANLGIGIAGTSDAFGAAITTLGGAADAYDVVMAHDSAKV